MVAIWMKKVAMTVVADSSLRVHYDGRMVAAAVQSRYFGGLTKFTGKNRYDQLLLQASIAA
jgi:hypothetical protein